MDYSQEISLLKLKGYNPIPHKIVNDSGELVDGLEIECSPFWMQRNKAILEDLLGKDYVISIMPNSGFIYIKKKKA